MNEERCPACGGETTFGFGLAGGGTLDESDQVVPGGYTLCLDCDWQGSEANPDDLLPEWDSRTGLVSHQVDVPSMLAALRIPVVRQAGEALWCNCPIHGERTGKRGKRRTRL